MACSSIASRARSACCLVWCASASLGTKLQTWHCKKFCISLLVYLTAQTSPAKLHSKHCAVVERILVLQGQVPLHYAVFFSTSGLKAEILLAHGADACAKDLKVGFTCSRCASLGFFLAPRCDRLLRG